MAIHFAFNRCPKSINGPFFSKYIFLCIWDGPSSMKVNAMASNSESYEEEHVHKVYQEIAPHFSSTRYKVCSLSSSIIKINIPNRVSAVANCREVLERYSQWLYRPRCRVWQWEIFESEFQYIYHSLRQVRALNCAPKDPPLVLL